MTVLENRCDIVVLFDVTNGNPNGDPDAGNMPRIDPETGLGLVSDVCLKRKIRNYVELAREDEPGHRIYVRDGSLLNETHREAYLAVRPDEAAKTLKAAKLNPENDQEANVLRQFMCDNFYDVRTFGAVMGTGINCGQVRGPVQFAFGRSLEPVAPGEITITRMAATSAKELKDKKGDDSGDERSDNRTMGRKYIVPYGLYRAHAFVSAKLAGKTGFGTEDLDLLLEAIENMFEHDRSASRGEMVVRKLIVFRHASQLGNAPAHRLFERVTVSRRIQGQVVPVDLLATDRLPARSFADYQVDIDRDGLPEGVEIIERL